jgi:prepilin-type N-terminal cleavage/methylation domain-containing protein
MNTLKGLTLIEVLVSIVIISLLIGVLVQIMLLYNQIQREHSQLTNDTLQAKEIGIKIEKQMALSNYILIVNTSTYDWIETSKYKFQLNKNLPKEIIIKEEGKPDIEKKKLSDYIYWEAHQYNNIPKLYEIKFYVYNKYAKKYRNQKVKKLAYYISITKY